MQQPFLCVETIIKIEEYVAKGGYKGEVKQSTCIQKDDLHSRSQTTWKTKEGQSFFLSCVYTHLIQTVFFVMQEWVLNFAELSGV